MKIICRKNDVMEGINICLRAVPAKTTMNILSCIVVRANSNNIKFVSNDMEIAIETVVPGTVEESGSVAIEAKMFADMVRKITDEEITIETNDYHMTTIKYGINEMALNCRGDEEFPALPNVEKQDALRMSQFALKNIILQTVFSISDNESQKIMTGELFEINGRTLKAVALDGHRVSIRKIELSQEYAPTKVIIPGKTLNEISKILSGEADDTVNIYFTKNHIMFELENTIVLSRLIEGEYYKIDQMLSGDYDTKLTVNRRSFMDTIDRSTIFIRETDKKPIILDITDNNINLKVVSPLGTINEDIPVTKEGKDITIGLNPKFLLDDLRVIEDEEVTMYMTNSKAPCYIRNAEETYIYLVLPISFGGR